MFGILKPAKFVERIQDPKEIKKKYRYWQFRTLYGMYGGYAVYYFTRKNLPAVMPFLLLALSYSKVQIGWILTISSLAYGLSKFTSGIISDRSNPRYFMAFGLIITGCLNLLFGFSSSLVFFAVIWGLNGWFQGCGWPPCSRLLTHWYSHKERARWWSIWNTSHNLGGFLIPLVTIQAIHMFGSWQWGMYIPGILAIVTGIFLINRLRDTPQSLGLPPIEVHAEELEEGEGEQNERELTTKELLFKYVLTNRFIWILALASFFVYFIRQAINDWSLVYLTQVKHYPVAGAAFCLSLFEAGGLFGSLASGWLSDIVFKGRRGPVNVFFSGAIVFSVLGLWLVPAGHAFFMGTAMFLTGFFVFGPQMLIGIAAAELSHKKAAATATGFCGFFAYVGAAFAGAPAARISEIYGWKGFFLTMAASAFFVTFLFLPLWTRTRRIEEAPEEEEEPVEAEFA